MFKAKEFEEVTPLIKEMFAELDADGSGELDLDELLNAPDELKDELGRFVDTEDMKELFELIDADGGGAIDVDEFIDGIYKVVSSDEPRSNIQARKQMQLARIQLSNIQEELPQIEERLMTSMKEEMQLARRQ